jgi:hypothetical protein
MVSTVKILMKNVLWSVIIPSLTILPAGQNRKSQRREDAQVSPILRKFDFEKVERQDFDKRNNVMPIADQSGPTTPLSMATVT